MPADLTSLWQRKASGITVQNDGAQALKPSVASRPSQKSD
jgi:hypothetical protein